MSPVSPVWGQHGSVLQVELVFSGDVMRRVSGSKPWSSSYFYSWRFCHNHPDILSTATTPHAIGNCFLMFTPSGHHWVFFGDNTVYEPHCMLGDCSWLVTNGCETKRRHMTLDHPSSGVPPNEGWQVRNGLLNVFLLSVIHCNVGEPPSCLSAPLLLHKMRRSAVID